VSGLMRLSFRLPGTRTCAAAWALVTLAATALAPRLAVYAPIPVLGCLITVLTDRLQGRDVPPNRWAFIWALSGAMDLAAALSPSPSLLAAIRGLSSTLLTMALLGTVGCSPIRSALVLLYLLASALPLSLAAGAPASLTLLPSAVGWSVTLVSIAILDTVTRSTLGVGTIEALSEFLQFKSGREHSLDAVFREIRTATRVTVPVRVLAFLRSGEVVGCFVIPWVHPGPVGRIGGGDLPGRIVRRLLDLGVVPLVFHSTTTHDLNPVDRREAGRIVDAVERMVRRVRGAQGSRRASRAVRGERTDSVGQVLGDRLFLVLSKYPEPSDDIDPATGIFIESRTGAWVADGHNCFGDPEKGRVYAFSRDFWRLLDDARLIAERVEAVGDLRAGFAHSDPGLGPESGVGSGGISVAAVEVEGQRTLYVVLDSNSIVRELKERLERELSELADEVVVCTSDSHEVNPRGYNPVGDALAEAGTRLVRAVREAAERAVDRIAPCEVVEVEEWVELTVTGPGSFQQLSHSVKVALKMIKVLLPATFLGVIVLSTAIALWASS